MHNINLVFNILYKSTLNQSFNVDVVEQNYNDDDVNDIDNDDDSNDDAIDQEVGNRIIIELDANIITSNISIRFWYIIAIFKNPESTENI